MQNVWQCFFPSFQCKLGGEVHKFDFFKTVFWADLEYPGCLFEQDHCAWEPIGTWKMSKFFPLRFLRKDWQNTHGEYVHHFTYLLSASSLVYIN